MEQRAVRTARVADAAGVALVQVAAWRDAYAGLMAADALARLDEARLAARWTTRLGDLPDGLRVSVATDDDTVVGFAVAGPTRDTDPPCKQELHAVNVLPEAQGTGVGRALLDAVVAPGACSLWVVVGNTRATALYLRLGFAADGTTVRDERLGVLQQRLVRLAR